MGDLDEDTALTGSDGRYTARLSDDWAIWGPNGGYVASLALRAAGVHSPFARPASFAAHFLGVAAFDVVDVSVRTLRRTKRAESLAVSITQGERPVLEALVWAIGDVKGLEHDALTMPTVPGPDAVPPMEERLPAGTPMFKFWDNIELRPTDWIDDWERRPPGIFVERNWYRFRPRATFDDAFLDAARSLLVLDTALWPTASRGHPENTRYYAPSIDVSISFHDAAPDDEWLLVDSCSPAAAGGLVGGTGAVWSHSGALLATGGQQMLCRPNDLLQT